MMRPTLLVSLVCVAACGDSVQSTATAASEASTATDTSDGTSPTSTPTTTTSPTSTTTATEGGQTDSDTGTTIEPTTSTTTEDSTTTTTTSETTSTTTSTTDPIDTTSTTTSTSTTQAETTTTTDTGETTDEPPPACECPDIEVPLDDGIFVLSGDAELWKYFPESNSFTMLGGLNCGGLVSTFSMAVDRQGFAWVQFVGGELRKVDVTNVSNCEDPGFSPGQLGVNNFGMAFVSNSQFDQCDRIYGNTYSGFGPFSEGPNIGDFLSIDPDSLQLSKLGKTNFDGAELTGTGDGRAFEFGGTGPAKLVEVDKASGAALEVLPLGGLEINNGAFAFAFFAGDFYFFTDSDNDFFASEVTRLDYDDSDMNGIQDLELLTSDAPLLIVGAGVSTCAPVAPM
ncbi:hypothetical protein [Nannocystis punicea]|uniref:Uncharacterized protein n=1 Tax=Nannocystis punicea TaxID=2995304 RepID=A0ABY7HCH3_9BACT|nr:hypothetical protein [Nannocystis poenicansa]WAS96973.1 hypothetical protein O0S08_12560 [Nannocystis poenicansa]